jgi:YVTN family beta-propeller protein
VACAAQFAYVANYLDESVSVVDTSSNAVIATIPVEPGPRVLAISPNGSVVYVGHVEPLIPGAGSLRIIDTRTFSVGPHIGVGAVAQILVNPFTPSVYVLSGGIASGTPRLSIIDTATGAVNATIPGGAVISGQIALGANGARLYWATGDTLQVIDTATDSAIASVDFGGTSGVTALAVHPAGTFVYLTDSVTGSLLVVNAVTNSMVASVTVGFVPLAVVLNSAGTRAYVMNWGDNSVSVIDTATNAVIATIVLGTPGAVAPVGLVINPAGGYLYVTANGVGTGTLSVIDISTNTLLLSRTYSPASFRAQSLAVSPDGSRVYLLVANAFNVLTSSGGTLVASLPGGEFPESIVVGPVVAAAATAISLPAIYTLPMVVMALLVAAIGVGRLRRC